MREELSDFTLLSLISLSILFGRRVGLIRADKV